MLTVKQAASRLGITDRAIYKAIRLGLLPADKPGRDYLLSPAAVDAYGERERVKRSREFRQAKDREKVSRETKKSTETLDRADNMGIL